jgi:hypothetical protein
MFDYATYALEAGKLKRKIHDLVLKERYRDAEKLAGELVVQARHLRTWLQHKVDEEKQKSKT